MTSNICDESKSTLAAEFYYKSRYTFDNCDNPCHVMTINAVNKNIQPKPDKIEVKIIFGNKIEVSKEILVQSVATLGEMNLPFINV